MDNEDTTVYDNETAQLKDEVLTKLDNRLVAIRNQMNTLQPLMSKHYSAQAKP